MEISIHRLQTWLNVRFWSSHHGLSKYLMRLSPRGVSTSNISTMWLFNFFSPKFDFIIFVSCSVQSLCSRGGGGIKSPKAKKKTTKMYKYNCIHENKARTVTSNFQEWIVKFDAWSLKVCPKVHFPSFTVKILQNFHTRLTRVILTSHIFRNKGGRLFGAYSYGTSIV